MTRPILTLPLLALALAGCGAMPAAVPSSAPAPAAEAPRPAPVIAQEVADEINGRVGQDDGTGVRVLGATARDTTVVADFELPLVGADLTEEERAEVGPAFTEAMRSGFCSDETSRRFFETGNILEVRFFGTDGVSLTDVSLATC